MCSTPFGIIGRLTACCNGVLIICSLCSTPFGIIGRLTECRKRRLFSALFVLNAFRHHRKTHLPRRGFGNSPYTCAQRLSASSEDSLCRFRFFNKLHPVLNAFRHH